MLLLYFGIWLIKRWRISQISFGGGGGGAVANWYKIELLPLFSILFYIYIFICCINKIIKYYLLNYDEPLSFFFYIYYKSPKNNVITISQQLCIRRRRN